MLFVLAGILGFITIAGLGFAFAGGDSACVETKAFRRISLLLIAGITLILWSKFSDAPVRVVDYRPATDHRSSRRAPRCTTTS